MRGILKKRDGFCSADIAAVWPVSAQIAPLPVLEVERCRRLAPVRDERAGWAGDRAKPRRAGFIGAGALGLVVAAAILL